jgi:hypothetical protein
LNDTCGSLKTRMAHKADSRDFSSNSVVKEATSPRFQ